MITTREDLINYSRGMELLGEIVSWNCSKVSITQTAIEDALKSADLTTHVTPELPFQTAFTPSLQESWAKTSDQEARRRLRIPLLSIYQGSSRG